MKSKEIRNKLLLDLFATPLSLIPIAIGMSAVLICFALNQYSTPFIFGIISTLFGIGVALSNFILNWGQITEKALGQLKEHERKEHKKHLDQLYRNLSTTREKQDEELLVELVVLYESFMQDIELDKIKVSVDVINQIDKIFKACVDSLNFSYELYLSASQAPKGQKQKVIDKRTLVLKEVEESIHVIHNTITEFKNLETKETQIKLTQLRDDLKTQIQIAKNTKETMLSIEYDQEKDYSEYLDKSI